MVKEFATKAHSLTAILIPPHFSYRDHVHKAIIAQNPSQYISTVQIQ